MRHWITIGTLIGIITLAAPAAGAAETGWYFGIGAARTETDLDRGDAANNIADGSTITSRDLDDTDAGGKLFGGYQFNDHFALEASLADLGEVKLDGVSDGSGSSYAAGALRANTDTEAFSVVGVGTLAVSNKIDLFIKWGFHTFDTETKVVDAGGNRFVDDDSGPDVTFGFGGEYGVGKSFAVRLEWERFANINRVDVELLTIGILFSR